MPRAVDARALGWRNSNPPLISSHQDTFTYPTKILTRISTIPSPPSPLTVRDRRSSGSTRSKVRLAALQPEDPAGEPAAHRGRREHHRRRHPRAGRLGRRRRAQQGDPVHPGPGDHAGLHRRALRGRPGHHARGDGRHGRRPGQDQPAGPGRAGHRPLGDRRRVRHRRRVQRNVEIEYGRNRERYQFLRWGQTAFDDFKVVPPGTGIVHQVNIEHLARVSSPR